MEEWFLGTDGNTLQNIDSLFLANFRCSSKRLRVPQSAEKPNTQLAGMME
jgi:hypothetical protein